MPVFILISQTQKFFKSIFQNVKNDVGFFFALDTENACWKTHP